MSALQLQALLEHILDKSKFSVKFAFLGGRLFINFTDAGGNRFYRSFGTDGSFVEHEQVFIDVKSGPEQKMKSIAQ